MSYAAGTRIARARLETAYKDVVEEYSTDEDSMEVEADTPDIDVKEPLVHQDKKRRVRRALEACVFAACVDCLVAGPVRDDGVSDPSHSAELVHRPRPYARRECRWVEPGV